MVEEALAQSEAMQMPDDQKRLFVQMLTAIQRFNSKTSPSGAPSSGTGGAGGFARGRKQPRPGGCDTDQVLQEALEKLE